MPDEIPSDEMHGLDPAELLARGLQTARRSSVAGGWTPPTAEKVARLLPQYGIESLIGRGGMGAVYKGVQRTLDRAVAIKLLPAEVAADAQFVTRFEREARTLAKLQHSRIVTIHDFGRTSEGHLYFVMEYIDGTNLRSILRGPGLDPEQALAVVGQLCDALQAAHRAGVIHRDIKPENVLVTTDGYVKLADFGLARPPQEDGESGLTQTNVVMGTPDYMAPEQRAGANKADHRSDIFALGVMFYEMLTGETPHGVFDPPSRRMQIDVRIDDVVLKALQSAPDRRYQKASEMKTDVEQIQSGPPAPAAPATPPPQAPAKAKGARGIMIAAAALGAVLVAGGIIFFLSRKGGEASRHQSTESLPGTPAPSEEVVKSRPPEDALHTTQNRDNTPSPATPAPAIQQAKLETPKPTVVAMVVPKIETPSAAKQTTPVPVATATPDPDRTRFEEALVSHAWSWNAGTNNAREAELTFRRDGSAICAGTAGQWTISDRRKVALSFNGAKIGLTFGESVQSFSAISEGPQTIVITGAAKGPAASTPTVPPVALAPTPKVEATPTPPPSTPKSTITDNLPADAVAYNTGFEPPTFPVGKFRKKGEDAVGDGHWTTIGVDARLDRALQIQRKDAGAGLQSLMVDSAPGGKTQPGVDVSLENSKPYVVISADLFLESSSRQCDWAFKACDPDTGGNWEVAGFNIYSVGFLQLASPGWPRNMTKVARDVWNHFELRLDIKAQTYDIFINGSPAAMKQAFVVHSSKVRMFRLGSFGNGNDKAYLDNVSLVATSKPLKP